MNVGSVYEMGMTNYDFMAGTLCYMDFFCILFERVGS